MAGVVVVLQINQQGGETAVLQMLGHVLVAGAEAIAS